MEFLSLSRRRSSALNVPSDEERGETGVFAGYRYQDLFEKKKLDRYLQEKASPCILLPVQTKVKGAHDNTPAQGDLVQISVIRGAR